MGKYQILLSSIDLLFTQLQVVNNMIMLPSLSLELLDHTESSMP